MAAAPQNAEGDRNMQVSEPKCYKNQNNDTTTHVNKRSAGSFLKSNPDKTQAMAHCKPCTSVGEVAGKLPGHGIDGQTENSGRKHCRSGGRSEVRSQTCRVDRPRLGTGKCMLQPDLIQHQHCRSHSVNNRLPKSLFHVVLTCGGGLRLTSRRSEGNAFAQRQQCTTREPEG